VLWTAVVLWMAVIFCLSGQVASQSSSLSGSTVKVIIEHTRTGFRELPAVQQNSIVENYQYLARKTAHMLAYLLLGILCMSALFQYSMKKGVRFAAAFAVGVAYAATDEYISFLLQAEAGRHLM